MFDDRWTLEENFSSDLRNEVAIERPRALGSLAFWRQPNGTIEVYFQSDTEAERGILTPEAAEALTTFFTASNPQQ